NGIILEKDNREVLTIGILEDIQNKFPSFSEKEKNLATFLLDNSHTLRNINISTLAKETNTSPATITMFAKKLNQKSFVDLKIQLGALKTTQDTKKTALNNEVYEYYRRVIENTEKLTDHESLKEIIQLMIKAPRIFI